VKANLLCVAADDTPDASVGGQSSDGTGRDARYESHTSAIENPLHDGESPAFLKEEDKCCSRSTAQVCHESKGVELERRIVDYLVLQYTGDVEVSPKR